MSADRLVEDLWGGQPPGNPANTPQGGRRLPHPEAFQAATAAGRDLPPTTLRAVLG